MSDYICGKIVAEGKTKQLLAVDGRPDVLVARCKDVLTRNDDPSQTADAPGKGIYVAAITNRVFKLFQGAGLPVAYERSYKLHRGEFLTRNCQIIPQECVARRHATGSYRQRFPGVPEDERFNPPIIEFFLKTSGGRVRYNTGEDSEVLATDVLKGNKPLEDPWIFNPFNSVWELRHPKLPAEDPQAWVMLHVQRARILPPVPDLMVELENLTQRAFLVLEKAWAALGFRLVDFKLEFGIDADGVVCIADEMSPDSWRLKDDQGRETSKELFRKGSTWEELRPRYHTAAELACRFPKVTPQELEEMAAS